MRNRGQLAIQIMFIVVCIAGLFSGHYPPAQAQVPSLDVQAEQIKEVNIHLQSTDGRADRQWVGLQELHKIVDANHAETEDLRRDYSHSMGIAQALITVLITLMGGSITLQVRAGKKSV